MLYIVSFEMWVRIFSRYEPKRRKNKTLNLVEDQVQLEPASLQPE